MATTLINTDITELSDQRVGFQSVSLDEWSTTTLPSYTAGSCFEQKGSLYFCTGDEVCGTPASWAGIGNGNICFSYHDPATTTFYYSTTAPSFDDAAQGYYHPTSPTHRCLLSIYKDSGGNYTQKTILYSREHGITYQGLCLISNTGNTLHASLLWDGTQLALHNTAYGTNSSVALTSLDIVGAAPQSVEFYIKLPITAYWNYNSGPDHLRFQIYQNAGWQDILTYPAATVSTTYGLNILPGHYRIYFDMAHANNRSYLYATSVFTSTSVVESEIVG